MASITTTRPAGPGPSDITTTDVLPTESRVLRRSAPLRVEGVAVVRWPAEEERRRELAERHEPCVLIVGSDQAAPWVTDLEDWIREPVTRAELSARCATVRARATCGAPPTLDDGVLFHRGAWAAIPPGQVAMVELLVESRGGVVHKEALAAAARESGASHHGDAVKTTMTRLRRRIAPLGLVILSIRGRGYLLEVDGACPLHRTRSATVTQGSCP